MAARKNSQNHNLLSKADIASALGMTSQTFANRATRDGKFPQPTYSNVTGTVSLYSHEDAIKVYDYVTRADRERLARAEDRFGAALRGEFKPVEEDEESDDAEKVPAEASAPVQLDGQESMALETEAPKVDPAVDAEFDKALTKDDKPADKPAESAPVDLKADLDKNLDALIDRMDAPKSPKAEAEATGTEAKADAPKADAAKAPSKADTEAIAAEAKAAPKAAPRARGGALTGRK